MLKSTVVAEMFEANSAAKNKTLHHMEVYCASTELARLSKVELEFCCNGSGRREKKLSYWWCRTLRVILINATCLHWCIRLCTYIIIHITLHAIFLISLLQYLFTSVCSVVQDVDIITLLMMLHEIWTVFVTNYKISCLRKIQSRLIL